MPSLGLDIGGSSVKAALLTAHGGCTVGTAEYSGAPVSAAVVKDACARAVRDLRGHADDEAALSALIQSSALCIGLCVPGVYDAAQRTIIGSINLPALAGTRIEAVLPNFVHADARRTLVVLTDALAAALDFEAAMQPRLQPAARLLTLALGTGVGCCVLDGAANGPPVQLLVNPGTSGHVGQIDVSLNDDPPRAPDGGRGGLEAYIGLPALSARFARVEMALRTMTLDDPALRALVRALRIAHAIYRPHHVALLGGVGVAIAQSPAALGLQGAVSHQLTTLARPGWTLGFAGSRHHAAAGAARAALTASAPRSGAPGRSPRAGR
ncbi:hypothetical protein BH11PLA1_BH11PLA1_04780 [soil metagenome]